MKINVRRWAALLMVSMLAFVLSLVNTGCSSSSSDENSITCKVLVTMYMSGNDAVDSTIDHFVYTFCDKSGNVLRGPVTRGRYVQNLFEDIPIELHSLSIGFYAGDELKYVYLQAFENIGGNQVVRIIYPTPVALADATFTDFYAGFRSGRFSEGRTAVFNTYANFVAPIWVEDTSYYITEDKPKEDPVYEEVYANVSGLTTYTFSEEDAFSSDWDKQVRSNFVAGTPHEQVEVTATLKDMQDSAFVEVTDETIESVSINRDSNRFYMPSGLDYVSLPLYATWSDGVITNVGNQVTWSTSETLVYFRTCLGRIFTYNTVAGLSNIMTGGVDISDDEKVTDKTVVWLVEATAKELTSDTPETMVVGEECEPLVSLVYDVTKFIDQDVDVETKENEESTTDVPLDFWKYTSKSSDTAVCSVDDHNIVKAVAPGTCTITTTYENDSGKKYTYESEITVTDAS